MVYSITQVNPMSSNDFMQLLVISSPKFHAKSGKTKKHRGGTLNITEIW